MRRSRIGLWHLGIRLPISRALNELPRIFITVLIIIAAVLGAYIAYIIMYVVMMKTITPQQNLGGIIAIALLIVVPFYVYARIDKSMKDAHDWPT